MVFLMETKVDANAMENIRGKLGFVSKFVVNSDGVKVGLCLFWSAGIDASLISYSRFHVDVQVEEHRNNPWRFTAFYGHLESSQRGHAWTLLRRLHDMSTLPWLCTGDFNEILYDSEKNGGLQRPRFFMDNFRHALDDSELQDAGFFGPSFTWSNKHEGREMVQERLDHCVCNYQWRTLFGHATKQAFLDVDFSPDEIKKVVFDMYLTKASGLDGLWTLFYQKYWSIVGDLVTKACLEVLNNGTGLENVNDTLIVLIPKPVNFEKSAMCMSKKVPNRYAESLARILKRPNSLAARVLKQCYYLDTPVLEATITIF
ncbi:hypothetical protein Ddye_031133 [Dipteronia dyeriana]|uniref:Endonuclease/exonuclease/phosphatase domain-containing protein n=1 Tax=Dipteronia dyeriana TaxID=168575 RepID=A0AAD9THZ3_9ROSI|nr:hypothetical protein Ddye_031133 [Dipteronia dyeriana]